MTEHAEVMEAIKGPQVFPSHAGDLETRYNDGNAVVDLASMRYLNESAIKQHALRCSARCRNNKFTRVGQDFIDEVKVDVEAFVRDLRTSANRDVQPHPMVEPDEDFLTGALLEKLKPILNKTVARIIQSKVQRQTTGKTLSATR